jgi:hypothetical protein
MDHDLEATSTLNVSDNPPTYHMTAQNRMREVTTRRTTMKTRTSHRLLAGLLIGAMTLSAGCTADQLQRVRETIDVADSAVDTTRKAMNTVEDGAK